MAACHQSNLSQTLFCFLVQRFGFVTEKEGDLNLVIIVIIVSLTYMTVLYIQKLTAKLTGIVVQQVHTYLKVCLVLQETVRISQEEDLFTHSCPSTETLFPNNPSFAKTIRDGYKYLTGVGQAFHPLPIRCVQLQETFDSRVNSLVDL